MSNGSSAADRTFRFRVTSPSRARSPTAARSSKPTRGRARPRHSPRWRSGSPARWGLPRSSSPIRRNAPRETAPAGRSAGRRGRRMELHERLARSPWAGSDGLDPFAEIKNRIHLDLVSELGPRLFDVLDSDEIRRTIATEIRLRLELEQELAHEDRDRLATEIGD